jgi:LacI family transcriptional regulator
MTLGIQTAAEELSALGYRRIGVAVTQWIVNRSQFGYSGGLFHFQQSLPEKDRIPLLLLPHNRIERGFAAFSRWLKENEPDVLISFVTQLSQQERGIPAVARQIMIPPRWVPGPSVTRRG